MKQKLRLMAMLWPILTTLTSMCLEARAQSERSEVPTSVGSPSCRSAAPPGIIPDTITPLQIGDTIPEHLWQMPFQLSDPQGESRIVRLADYRGKLILLDFWALWCSSCIKALPKLDKLQAEYETEIAVLPIIQSDLKAVAEFRDRNDMTRDLHLPVVVSDSILSYYFPHRSISHIAWISSEGRLISTTSTDPVEPKTIMHVLNGGKPYWVPKIDAVDFNYAAPLFQQGNHLIQNGDQPTYHSGLTSHQPGASPKVQIQIDSATNTIRAFAINQSVYQLILHSLATSQSSFPPNQIHWQVQDRSHYIQPIGTHREDWNRAHTYCYENVMPINGLSWREVMKVDLSRYFPGLVFSTDTGTYNCLVLVRTGKGNRFQSKGKKKLITVDESSPVKILRNCPVSTLINALNRSIVGMPVNDGTNYAGQIDIELPVEDLGDTDAVRRALWAYDLDLVVDRREYVRLFIKDQPDTF